MIKAIVFDCYGVLVGSSFWDIYQAAGGDTDTDEQFIEEMLARANAALISEDEFSEMMAARLRIPITEWEVLTARMQHPNERLLEYIRSELKPHYKIGLLSNANRGSVERRLSPAQRALFEAFVVSGEVGCMKPEREIFALAAARLGVQFAEMVFIDDLQPYVDAARSYGIQSICYRDLRGMQRQLSVILAA